MERPRWKDGERKGKRLDPSGAGPGRVTDGGQEQRFKWRECELLKEVPPSDQRLLNNPFEQWLHFSVRPKSWQRKRCARGIDF